MERRLDADALRRLSIGAAFFTEIWHARLGPRPDESVPKSKREKLGKQIADAAEKLRKSLLEIEDLVDLSDDFHSELERVATRIAKNETSATQAMADQERLVTISEHELDHDENVLHYGLMLAMSGDFAMLAAIERGARKWSTSKPVLYRPSDPTAPRTYFVIRLTSFFRRYFKSPLRAQTAAVTRVLFDCDIDSIAVTKLAP
jgi:hypothetical protein